MGCMLRSDLMSLCDVYFQPETAFDIISEIGELGCVQFNDMTPHESAYTRPFISELCRCAEMERKLRYLYEKMIKENIRPADYVEEPPALSPTAMLEKEGILEKWQNEITQMTEYHSELVKKHEQQKEMFYVMETIGPMLGRVEIDGETLPANMSPSAVTTPGQSNLGSRLIVITGVVARKRSHCFETMIWRISRGNIYYREATEDQLFEDHISERFVRKVAFLAVCQGEELRKYLDYICDGFQANLYPYPNTSEEGSQKMIELQKSLEDSSEILQTSTYIRCKFLRDIAREYKSFAASVKKAKAIYVVMNNFSLDITKKCLLGECWVPDCDLPKVKKVMESTSKKYETFVPSFMVKSNTMEEPPTYHRTNKFTNAFQVLINAYGNSGYRELNPGLYTIITFPFLFAVMFGDLGHGFLMFLFAFWMLYNEKKFSAQRSDNEIWKIIYAGRYIICLMGLFSMFTGFIYNDLFSKSMNFADSFWINTYSINYIEANEALTLDPAMKTKSPYCLGIDPIWALSDNAIVVSNSLKMKMSIILGVVHMMFGLTVGLFNHIYFKRYYAIVLEFIPELLFLMCLFLWLVFLIFFKWFTYSPKSTNDKLKPGCAPLILILFIDMALMRASKTELKDCDAYMFKGQQTIQKLLLVVGLLCVPTLLFGTPIYKMRSYKTKKLEAEKELLEYQLGLRERREKILKEEHKDKIEELLKQKVEMYTAGFSDLMILQGVHTIEYFLSTISHTASYLRLWALSLAHAQLSEMLWHMILSKLALLDRSLFGSIKIFVIFSIWAVFTIAILVIMEGLSAFLHTLRLHWVEFMSKFYEGTGEKFAPFSFNELLYGNAADVRVAAEGACKVGEAKKTKQRV